MRTGTTAHQGGGEALYRVCEALFARPSALLCATASVELGGFSDARDGVKVASFRLLMARSYREKHGRRRTRSPALASGIHATAGIRAGGLKGCGARCARKFFEHGRGQTAPAPPRIFIGKMMGRDTTRETRFTTRSRCGRRIACGGGRKETAVRHGTNRRRAPALPAP